MKDWDQIKDLSRRVSDCEWWEDDGSFGHQDVSWHPHSRIEGRDVFPNAESQFIWMLTSRFEKIEAVIEAADELVRRKGGFIGDLQKALRALKA